MRLSLPATARLCFFASLTLLASCMTTRNVKFVEADEGVESREYERVAAMLDGPQSSDFYRDKDQVLRYLDTGMLYHMAALPERSTASFNEAERLIEENYTKSITNAAASFLLNDYSLEYFGEAYEDIYLNVFKSIDYIRRDSFDGAFVEVRRIGNKLNLLEDKYGKIADGMNSSSEANGAVKAGKTEFHNSALARYLSVLLYRADGRTDDAALDLRKLREAFSSQPKVYDFPPPQLDQMLAPTDKARLNVIGFSGRSPSKRANTYRLVTAKDLIVVTMEKEDDKGQLYFTDVGVVPFPKVDAGYYFKCQLPEMIQRPSRVARVSVIVDGVRAGDLALLERLDAVAMETFQLSQTPVFFKTVIRTVAKGLLAEKAKDKAWEAASNAGGIAGLFALAGGIAADVAVEASEQADLRSARYFPGEARVGEFLIESGEHDVAVEYYAADGRLLYKEAFPRKNYTKQGLNVLSSYDLE
jgi:hypothetical protein